MKYYLPSCLSILLLVLLLSCSDSATTHSGDTSEPTAKPEEWIPLFNGKDLTGWTPKFAGYAAGENPRNTIRVEDSMLRVDYSQYDQFDDLYGHLYFEQPYSHYHLRFDYRFTGKQTPGGADWNVRNSGVMLHSESAENNEKGQHFPVSVELQLLGGLGEGERTTGNVCTPGTAVVMGDTINYNHCISSSSKTYHGDQWVRAEAIVRGGESMTFIIEGDTVLYFEQPQIGGGLISQNNDKAYWDDFGMPESRESWLARDGEILEGGYIALQAESHPIDFKNIEIKELEP